MSGDLIEQLIARSAICRKLDRGAHLFHQGDPVISVFVVKYGSVELVRHQSDGTQIVLQRAASRSVFAEASIYSETYHCDAVVAQSSMIFESPKTMFLNWLDDDNAFSNLWAAHLAREVQAARYRSEILTRKTVAERLDGWLAWQDHKLPAKGQWKNVALQIGVSHEALYRELAKRRAR